MKSRFRAATGQWFFRVRAEFKRLWKNYLYQSFFAAVVLFTVLMLLNLENAVVIASIGSTAFIVFTMPRSITARPGRVIGGHLIGLAAGSLCALIPQSSMIISVFVYSLAVGVSLFLMVALDMEHPPASGTALGVAMTGFSPGIMVAVVTSSLILAVAHRFSRRFLKDLT